MKNILKITLFLLIFVAQSCQNSVENATAKIEAAVQLFNENNFEAALKAADKILKENPKDYFALTIKGRAFFALDKKAEALEALNQSIAINPEYYEAFAHRGMVYYTMTEYEKALADINIAIEHDAKNMDLLEIKANIYYALADYKNAVTFYNQVIAIDSKKYESFVYRANSNRKLGNNDLVLSDFEKAIALNPENAFAYQSRADYLTYTIQDKFETAVKDYDKIISLFNANISTENQAYAYNNRGFAKYKLGRFGEAMTDIEQSLSLFPENAYAYKNRALVNLAKGDKPLICKDLAKAESLGFTEKYGSEVVELMKGNCGK
jgi:tetratricopeptide (TPR) repeat protein